MKNIHDYLNFLIFSLYLEDYYFSYQNIVHQNSQTI